MTAAPRPVAGPSQAEAPRSEATRSEAPQAEQPGTEQPGTEQPGTEQPGTEQPAAWLPQAARPGAAVVTGLGIAVPDAVDQQRLWEDRFDDHFGGSPLARRIFAGAGVRQRHTVVDLAMESPHDWSTAERMRRYAREAPGLGHRAVVAALADAGLAARDVGQLTVASCTGYDTPGLDIRLAGSLGLEPGTQRLLVGHMGCYAALPALGSAADFVTARGRPAVLLCLELPSLHLQPPTDEVQQVVTHALFGDAAVALVLLPGGSGTVRGAAATGAAAMAATAAASAGPEVSRGRDGLELVDLVAHTDPTTADLMTWRVTDHGFRMGLSAAVPDVLATQVRPVTERLLTRHGLDVADVAGWAVHPGGPRILETVEGELDLAPDALDASRAVLAEYGNCSSPTVLLVLDRLSHGPRPADGAPVVAMAFGPGLTLYAALFRVRRRG
ncbi:type III polyketide synthase [Streptomyces otsuchiensis]|uniref:type III polyketide synthase n=1 Tax=Streptomyces otsuchiensis TaxID=2681388 RepID=UPI001D131CCD|nr:type III polyketide synthase [Streptomyces otsuchiensis]